MTTEQGPATRGALQRKGSPSRLPDIPSRNHRAIGPHNFFAWRDTMFDWPDRALQARRG